MCTVQTVCYFERGMCLALPYRIVTLLDPTRAVGEGPGGPRQIDLSLIGPVVPGTYVLVTYGSATQVVTADEAAGILQVWHEIDTEDADS